jgi:hypothetical protein
MRVLPRRSRRGAARLAPIFARLDKGRTFGHEPQARHNRPSTSACAFAGTEVARARREIGEADEFPRDRSSAAGALMPDGRHRARRVRAARPGLRGVCPRARAIARASATVAVILAVNNSLAERSPGSGPSAQRSRWLAPLASGRSVGAFALSEEHAGTDAARRARDATAWLPFEPGQRIVGRQRRGGRRHDRLRRSVGRAGTAGRTPSSCDGLRASAAGRAAFARRARAHVHGPRFEACASLRSTARHPGRASDCALGAKADAWPLPRRRSAWGRRSTALTAKRRRAFGQPIATPSRPVDARGHGDRARRRMLTSSGIREGLGVSPSKPRWRSYAPRGGIARVQAIRFWRRPAIAAVRASTPVPTRHATGSGARPGASMIIANVLGA